jgi:predicted nucleotidyltransferase
MNNFLIPYTVNKSRPVDPVTLHILSVVNRVAAELGLPYIVVGATARDLLLFHVFGIPVTRATADVDFAMAMDSWDRFRELRAAPSCASGPTSVQLARLAVSICILAYRSLPAPRTGTMCCARDLTRFFPIARRCLPSFDA